VSDNFTRANGAVGNATTGQAWTAGTGWAIASNKLAFTGTSDASAWINPGVAEWDAELVIDSLTAGAYPFGLGVGDPAGTWIKVYRDNGLWRCGVYNVAALVGTLKDTSGLLGAETLTIRRRKNMFTLEAGGTVVNSPIYTEPSGTQFGIIASGNFPLTISRLTLTKHDAPITPA
jgi:hypothetical protein